MNDPSTPRSQNATPYKFTPDDVENAALAALTGTVPDPAVMARLGPRPGHDYLQALSTRIHQLSAEIGAARDQANLAIEHGTT